MNVYYITGTSSGIGKELAISLLKNNENSVIGISRNCTISHKNYKHISIDFSNISEVNKFNFELPNKTNKIVLINNAGVIGDIKQIGKIKVNDIANTYNINTVTPSILMNKFANSFQNISADKTILNISSGAGRHTIESWSTYCASKSALDMFSEVFYEEQKRITKQKAIKIYSIAPGIIDTQMQVNIRASSKTDFNQVDKFIGLKEQNLLSSPNEIANQLINIIDNTKKNKDVICDLRNI